MGDKTIGNRDKYIFHEPVNLHEKKLPELSSLLETIPLPDLSVQTETLKVAKPHVEVINDELLEELNRVASTLEQEIIFELKSLENGAEMIGASMDVEGIYKKYPEITADVIKSGVEFFESVLPKEIQELPGLSETFEITGEVAQLTGLLIMAAHSGAELAAVICKDKMLHQSRNILNQMKAVYLEKDAAILVDEHNAAFKPVHPENLQKIQKLLKKWEASLKNEEKKLRKEKISLGITGSYTAVHIGVEILHQLPLNSLSFAAKTAIKKITGCVLDFMSVVISGLEFFKALMQTASFNAWTESYGQWQKKHTHVIDKSNKSKGAEIHALTPLTPSPSVSRNYENELMQIIEKGRDLATIQSNLAEFSIGINPDIKTKSELISYLQTNTSYKTELIQSYSLFIDKLDKLNEVIKTSQDLLEKRQAVIKKKILLFKPKFEELKPKILETSRIEYQDSFSRLFEELNFPIYNDGLKETFHHLGLLHNTEINKAFQSYQKSIEDPSASTELIDHQLGNLRDSIYKLMVNKDKMEVQFQKWFESQPKENVLRSYIDHQETIELTTKNALREVIENKHVLESKFIKFNLFTSTVSMNVALVCLAISISLAILGAVTLPFGGIGVLLLITGAGPAALSLTFLFASLAFSLHERPKTTKAMLTGLNTKISWNSLNKTISSYRHQSKVKKLKEEAKILRELHKGDRNDHVYKKAFTNYQKAKADVKESEEKVKKWTEKLTMHQTELATKGWQDFIHHAALVRSEDSQSFDSLIAFRDALSKCNLELLSDETKFLIQTCLGIDLPTLQKDLDKYPQAIQEALKSFASLKEDDFVDFIRKQGEGIKAKIIPGFRQIA